MKHKKNNNLILVKSGNETHYFTTTNRAGKYLGLQANSINWAIVHGNILFNNKNEEVTISLIDGSEIPYKYINN